MFLITTITSKCPNQSLYLYHLQRLEDLQTEDYARRIEFCLCHEATFTQDTINMNRHFDVNPHTRVTADLQNTFSANVCCGVVSSQMMQHLNEILVAFKILKPHTINKPIYCLRIVVHIVPN